MNDELVLTESNYQTLKVENNDTRRKSGVIQDDFTKDLSLDEKSPLVSTLQDPHTLLSSCNEDSWKLSKRNISDQTINSPYDECNQTTDSCQNQRSHIYQIHGRLRQFVSKLKTTHRVCDLMTRILKGEPIESSDYLLKSFEMVLITHLVFRKYHNSTIEDNTIIDEKFNEFNKLIEENRLILTVDFIDTSNHEEFSSQMKKFIDFLQSLNICKRVEENNKFVYKHTTSFLLTQFVYDNDLKFNSASEHIYYQHYFGSYATSKGLKVGDFCDPLKTKLRTTRKTKSLNTDYILRILGCDLYKKEFFKYLYKGFEEDYLSATYKKLQRMLIVLDDNLNSAATQDQDKILREFIRTKINHRWCKIPWNRSEVKAAVAHFVNYFGEMMARRTINHRKIMGNCKNVNSFIVISNSSDVESNSNMKKVEQFIQTKHSFQSVGTILFYPKRRISSLSLFEPSNLYLMFK